MRKIPNISGKVTDSNNEALIGANIFIPGLSIGASSDANGNFQIRNVKSGTYKLRASFVGYSTVEKEVVVNSGDVTNVNFVLEEDLLGLREIVAKTIRQNLNLVNRT
ncbi:MAG: carboxypeptidase-like regulatory domain-containing protein [Chitinophagales bacterium]|nr:carboxypeptidase-like regulatory domain-containing protein [Chitinophagales bacterium]